MSYHAIKLRLGSIDRMLRGEWITAGTADRLIREMASAYGASAHDIAYNLSPSSLRKLREWKKAKP